MKGQGKGAVGVGERMLNKVERDNKNESLLNKEQKESGGEWERRKGRGIFVRQDDHASAL